MVGMERVVIPLLAEQEFGLVSRAAIFSFIVSFGLTKAFANLFAGRMSDRIGRDDKQPERRPRLGTFSALFRFAWALD
jgi:hypothetical protein